LKGLAAADAPRKTNSASSANAGCALADAIGCHGGLDSFWDADSDARLQVSMADGDLEPRRRGTRISIHLAPHRLGASRASVYRQGPQSNRGVFKLFGTCQNFHVCNLDDDLDLLSAVGWSAVFLSAVLRVCLPKITLCRTSSKSTSN